MSAVEEKLRKMGYTLPPTFKFPNPNRTGCVVVGSIVFVSGHGRDLPVPAECQARGKGRAGPDRRGRICDGARRRPVHPCQPEATARRSRSDQAGRAAVRHGQRGAWLRPDAAGHRRGVGFLLRAVRSGKWPARTLGGRARGTPARHPGRDQRGIRASLMKCLARLESQRRHPGRVRRSAVTTVPPGERSGTLTTGGSHGCSLASHRNFGSGS